MDVVQEPTVEAKPAPPVLLPNGFAEMMEDGTPVTSQNLLAYLAQYVEEEGLLHDTTSAVVAGFLQLRDAIIDYLFSFSNFSKERMCFIVDLMVVRSIFYEFYSNHGYGRFVVSSGELASGWEAEKVEALRVSQGVDVLVSLARSRRAHPRLTTVAKVQRFSVVLR